MSERRESIVHALFLIGVAAALFALASILPVHIDEALTHRHFASQGWKIALSSYPFPNNHVLFSVIASWLVHLPMEPVLAMRLISVVAATVCAHLLFTLLRRNATALAAWLGTLLWLCSMGGLYYGIHARGYGLQLVFILIDVGIVQHWVRALPEKKHSLSLTQLAVLILSSALGFLTVPTFLFPFASILVWMLISALHNGLSFPQALKPVLVTGTATTVLTLMLYAPLLHYSGVDALLHNQWVAERQFEQLTPELIRSFFIDLKAYIGWPVILLFVIGSFSTLVTRNCSALLLVLCFLLTPAVLIMALGSLPFPRTFVYLTPLLILFGFSALQTWLQTSRPWAVGILAAGVLYSTAQTIPFVRKSLHKQSALAKTLHAELDQQFGDAVVNVIGWNECAHLMDYYTWREQHGPRIQFIYNDQVVQQHTASGTLLLVMDNKTVPTGCMEVFRQDPARVYRCR